MIRYSQKPRITTVKIANWRSYALNILVFVFYMGVLIVPEVVKADAITSSIQSSIQNSIQAQTRRAALQREMTRKEAIAQAKKEKKARENGTTANNNSNATTQAGSESSDQNSDDEGKTSGGSINDGSEELQEISQLTNEINDEVGDENKQKSDDEAGASDPISMLIKFFSGRSSQNYGQGDTDHLSRLASYEVDRATQYGDKARSGYTSKGINIYDQNRSKKTLENIADLKRKGYYYNSKTNKVQTPYGQYSLQSYKTLDGMVNVHGLTREQALKVLRDTKKKNQALGNSAKGRRLAFLKKKLNKKLKKRSLAGGAKPYPTVGNDKKYEETREEADLKPHAGINHLDMILKSLGGSPANSIGGIAPKQKIKLFKGTPIGIQTDNIFNIIIRAYDRKKRKHAYFIGGPN